jgi:hypothetical protein
MKEDWGFGAIRPANYPYMWLVGLAHLNLPLGEESIFAGFVGTYQKTIISSNQAVSVKITLNSFNDLFSLAAYDYGENQYTPMARPCATPATDWLSGFSLNYYQNWPAHRPDFCASRKI